MFNGDAGKVSRIDQENEYLYVKFKDGWTSCYEFDELENLSLAYALIFAVILSSVTVLVILIVINQGRELLQIKIFTEIHNDVSFDIFSSAFQKLLHLKKNYFSDKNTAEILNFLQTDISQVASITDQYTVTCISYLFRIVSGLIGLFIINWKLAMVVLAMVPAKYLLVRHLSKRQEKAMDALIEKSREFSGWFGDNIEEFIHNHGVCLWRKEKRNSGKEQNKHNDRRMEQLLANAS